MTSSNDPVDIIAGGYDAGVQLGEFIQKDMIAIQVTKEMRLAVASQDEGLRGAVDDGDVGLRL